MATKGQSHNWRSQVWAFSFVSTHIFFTTERIFIKLWSNVHLSEIICRTHNSAMPTQSQIHDSGSRDWNLNFASTSYLLYPWMDFPIGQIFVSVRQCAEPCQLNIDCNGVEPLILYPLWLLHISFITRKGFIIFLLNVWLSETMCRAHD